MRKDYQKPEVETIKLVSAENIATDSEFIPIEGSMGVEDSIFD